VPIRRQLPQMGPVFWWIAFGRAVCENRTPRSIDGSNIAPSTELRRWFGHDPVRWDEFRRRYRAEFSHETDLLNELVTVLHTLFAGKKVPANPWGEGATTLEWTVSSPPPFHSYEKVPVVK
jgi:hypothetical protein